MKKRKIIWNISILLFMLLCVFAIFKLNTKINILAETVQAKDTSSYLSIIPDLTLDREGWKITQFGDPNEEQEVCYVITTSDGLVIIDGGCTYEVPRLREIIRQYDNHVDAWFLSHPHPDHINAFLSIYEDMQGITIDHIYTANHPSIEVMQERASWDDFSAVEKFYQLDAPLEYLYEGDTLTVLGGLKIKVLNAYGDKVKELSKDYMNDGALMLKVSGTKQSMIFCTDVGKSMGEYLVETYGDELKADYLQMGHHGNGGPGKLFIKAVHPKGAFFDSPAWLMKNEEKPTTKKNEKIVEKLGAIKFTFYTAPNQILLE